jgi:hypothetical protein
VGAHARIGAENVKNVIFGAHPYFLASSPPATLAPSLEPPGPGRLDKMCVVLLEGERRASRVSAPVLTRYPFHFCARSRREVPKRKALAKALAGHGFRYEDCVQALADCADNITVAAAALIAKFGRPKGAIRECDQGFARATGLLTTPLP